MVAGHAGRSEDQAAIADEQAATARGFDLFPDLVGAQNQRHKFAALADGLAGNARVAVRRALIVRRDKAIDADGASAKPGRLIEGRAAHGSEADDQNVRGVGTWHWCLA